MRQADRAGRERAAQDWSTHAVEGRFRPLRGRERPPSVILVRDDLRARAEGRRLAGADVGQPGALSALAACGNLRQIKRMFTLRLRPMG
jgi:hypothetical protein